MAKSKHRPDATEQINEYINGLPEWSKKICNRLRQIVLKSDPKLIEDWKWGPNYYLDGMVCGYAAFQKHVNFVFFQGALLKDKNKKLIANPGTLHNRHLRFTHVAEIDENLLLSYLIETIGNNKKGKKIVSASDKTISISADIDKSFTKEKVLSYFNSLAYSHKKEYLMWIEEAKKAETREKRIMSAVSKLKEKQTMHDKYKKQSTAPSGSVK